jgi:3-oxoacyl-(acyl-carrier-protein) synthase
MMNRPGYHAHEADAAAAINQINAPPHLREGKKHMTLNYQEPKETLEAKRK